MMAPARQSSRQTRSLLLANDFPPVVSGIATFFSEIWRHLPPERTEILAPSHPAAEPFDRHYPIAVHRIRLPLGERLPSKILKTVLPALWVVWRFARGRRGPIHCGQVFSSGFLGLLCHRAFGTPYVVYVYGSETVRLGQTRLARWVMRQILGGSDQVVTNSRATSNEFIAFGVPRERLHCIYPGVDPAAFRALPKDAGWLERLGIGPQHRVLLTVSRLDQRKGHDVVLRALRRLPENVIYLIAGRGREEQQLRKLAAELGVVDRVRFLGFVPDEDLPTVYNLCDVFVMPNRVTEGTRLEGDIEGFGITFLEAGSCGKPVVGGKSGGAVEAVVDGETGLLVDPTSEDAVAGAARTLLEDSDLSRRLGGAARERIIYTFDWRILARQVEEIL